MAKPFVKWAGGKEKELYIFLENLPNQINNFIFYHPNDFNGMLNELSLNDTYCGIVNMGSIISRDKKMEEFIFKFSYGSRLYKDISDSVYRKHIWFDFNPIKKKYFTEDLKEEFKRKVIPLMKSEILYCIKRNDIVEFVSTIKVFIEDSKLKIQQEDS